MDPTEALAAARYASQSADNTNGTEKLEHLIDLQDRFLALDEWLTKGGFLPEPWQRSK